MNYLEEIQRINEDYQKAKLVVMSCYYAEQLQSAIEYSTQLVRFHCNRLGISKKFENKLKWFLFEKEKKQKKKIIEYIDLCVNSLQEIVDEKKIDVQELFDSSSIGYGDPDTQVINRVIQDIKKWEKKKEKENLDHEYRTFEREKLQVY